MEEVTPTLLPVDSASASAEAPPRGYHPKRVPLPDWVAKVVNKPSDYFDPQQEKQLVRLVTDLHAVSSRDERFKKMIINAMRADYSDFESDLDDPTMAMYFHLQEIGGVDDMVQNVTLGKYDHGYVYLTGEDPCEKHKKEMKPLLDKLVAEITAKKLEEDVTLLTTPEPSREAGAQ